VLADDGRLVPDELGIVKKATLVEIVEAGDAIG
jgi:hypothetical protein